MACVECRGYYLVSACPCCADWDEEEEDDETVGRREDPLWNRMAEAGYTCEYRSWVGGVSFIYAFKEIRRVERVARRDHKDGKIRAGQRYVEVTTRFVDSVGRSEHKVTKRVIG